MTPHTQEPTINSALGEILRGLGRSWTVQSEQAGRVFEEGGHPDVLIHKQGGAPVVIEAEVGNHRQAEIEAQSRLGNYLAGTGGTIDTVVALVYPNTLRGYEGQELRDAIVRTNFEYSLFLREPNETISRIPTSGWLSGSVLELAQLLHRTSVPAWRVETLSDVLELGVNRAVGAFTDEHPPGSALGQNMADVLGQSDDEAGQTRKMAMTVIVNALVFHEALAEAEMSVTDEEDNIQRSVIPPRESRAHGSFRPSHLIDEWERILAVNYWPIFHTAGAILRGLPTQSAVTILNLLWETAEELVAGGVTQSHDLTGIVFQRLIADRKFLATFYTRPSAASLLAGLALPIHQSPRGSGWGDPDVLFETRLGDFACGTGTLLSTAYQRLSLLHELHGGDPRALHPRMMSHGLVGLDVLNVAVHLTAAMLAGSFPDTPFDGECLLTMPYGRHDWGVSVGSLDLLDEQTSFEIMQAAALTAGGRGTDEVRNLLDRVGHGQFDLVIMNPPFTRHGAREGDRTQVHNPAFAAFKATEEEQNQLASHLRRLASGGCAHGHAGLASYFVDLAHRKTKAAGTKALVLPLSAMSGTSWQKVRSLWWEGYSSILVVTIAERGTHSKSFSADTGMAECLVVARKSRPDGERRANFVVLSAQPQTTLEGELIARTISATITEGGIKRLEDGPVRGTRLIIGDEYVGEIIDSPLPVDGAWQVVGISDLSLGQTAYQLSQSRLWVEGMSARNPVNIPVATIGDVCEQMGPHDLDLCGSKIKDDGLPQGPFERISEVSPGAAYPSLWNHECTRERHLIVLPDSHCLIREVEGRIPDRLRDRAERRWATATRAHYSRDCRFNSQSLIVATTEQPALGGRAWPSVIFQNRDYEFAFALWCNSTLGLLCHWWASNKSQSGRGQTTVTSIPFIPTLNLSELSEAQHGTAREVFDDLAEERFLPFDQVNEDPARALLDRRLLVDVLQLDPSLCHEDGPIELLRMKLALEPQIHGGKGSCLVFTEDGEMSVRRDSNNGQ